MSGSTEIPAWEYTDGATRIRGEVGLEKPSRRIPPQYAATFDEVRAAVEALTVAELVKLEKYARYRIRVSAARLPAATTPTFFGEAVQDTLDPEKRRWNKNFGFASHLIGAMRSISSHWREQFDVNEPILESELIRTNKEGDLLSPLDFVGSDAAGSERILLAKQEVERIKKAVADDKVVARILDGVRAEMSPSEIRRALGLTVNEYETAMKRFRRRVRPTARPGQSDG